MDYHKGFIAPLLLVLIATFLLGGGAYVYVQKNQVNQLVTGNVELPQATPTTQTTSSQMADWETYTNSQYGFELNYPSGWNIVAKENDLGMGAVISIFFFNPRPSNTSGSEFHALISCFDYGSVNADPFYKGFGDLTTPNPITVDGVATLLYQSGNQNGEGGSFFYLPLVKQKGNQRCGVIFVGFTDLTEIKKEIITSLHFTNGFETFVDLVLKQFKTNPPTKG